MMKMPNLPIPRISKNHEPKLERCAKILDLLGNPQRKMPPVIHVAGTNGKGSTVAFLHAIFKAAGYKVHRYTSPHLIEYNERIILDSKKISDDYLHQLCDRFRLASEELGLDFAFFEWTTVMAFIAFAETEGDIVILETGLGGRLDITNIIEDPIATVITPVSNDHNEYLGPTPAIIAKEKGGIIKHGSSCIISLQYDDVYEVLFDICDQLTVPSFAFGYDFGVEIFDDHFLYRSQDKELKLPHPSLQGDHQFLNAATAIAVTQNIKGFDIKDEHITEGVTNASWPGRLQKITKGPIIEGLEGEQEIWIDGAHNLSAAQMLSNWAYDRGRELHIIFGLSKGRNVAEFISPFEGVAKHCYGILVEAEPASYNIDALSEKMKDSPLPFTACDSLEEAVAKAKEAAPKDGVILITGSLFLVGDVLTKNG